MKTWQGTAIGIAVLVIAYFTAAFFNHPPKESQDWAAWIQAVGSIAAIIGTFSVLYIQHERELRNEQARRNIEHSNALMMAIYTAENFREAMRRVIATADAFPRRPDIVLKGAEQQFAAIGTSLGDIPFMSMLPAHAQAIAALKVWAGRNELGVIIAGEVQGSVVAGYIDTLRTHEVGITNMLVRLRDDYRKMTGTTLEEFGRYPMPEKVANQHFQKTPENSST